MNPEKLVNSTTNPDDDSKNLKQVTRKENDCGIDTSNSTQNTVSSSTSGKLTQSENSAFEEATSVEATMLSKITDKSLSHDGSSDYLPKIAPEASSSQVSLLLSFLILILILYIHYLYQTLYVQHVLM